ncbi:hypothetical protein CRUP_010553 [Coryphaenoides rupestris]|nr:hypothetical protein CRUP_010553 [Coryphaenoides rupestris]
MLKILGFVAKGSFVPILKVEDKFTEKTYAVKVLPKSEVLKRGDLQQTKEEVTIQQQHKHTFLHNLQDCWQTQRHLFILCDYCSTGDLYTYWLRSDHFEEDDVRLFAAELGSALVFWVRVEETSSLCTTSVLSEVFWVRVRVEETSSLCTTSVLGEGGGDIISVHHQSSG